MTTYSARGDSPKSGAERPKPDLDLIAGDRRYGWISGDRVGFVGFSRHPEAVQAAWVAHRILMRRLGRAPASAPMSEDPTTFAVASVGDDEVILANGEPIAALVRPTADSSPGSDSFGFEIRLPGHPDEISVRATAYRIYLALRSSGVAWPRRRANTKPVAGERRVRPTIPDHSVAFAGDTTTIEDGGHNEVIDQSGEQAPSTLPPQWSRRRTRVAHRERNQGRARRAAGAHRIDDRGARADDDRRPRGARRRQRTARAG